MALPAATLVAAHWFPWRKLLKRDLHPLEAYAIGTTAIVGTATVAIALSDGDNAEHVTMLGVATTSAGTTTIAAHAIDAFIRLWHANADLRAQIEALKNAPKL